MKDWNKTKEKLYDFFTDYLIVAMICLKVVGFASLIIVPILLGCMVSPWFFISLVFIFPLLVTILIRAGD